MTPPLTTAPHPNVRLIPAQFPPVAAFDTVATAADLPAILALVGWTDDTVVADRLGRLSPAEWAFGRPNASVIMGAFLHAGPSGARFNGFHLGAWYAAGTLRTGVAEVGHHLRRELAARGLPHLQRSFQAYAARLEGPHQDLRGPDPALAPLFAPDSHAASQAYGEAARAAGVAGLVYGSVRHAGGVCSATFRPSLVRDVVAKDAVLVTVTAGEKRIDAVRLPAP